ncbi:MAG: hypothetical protein R6U19_01770 [Bacteroidales bacterium]
MVDEKHIKTLVEEELQGTAYYLISCSVSENNKVVVVLDGDSDVTVRVCEDVNRFLESSLDRERDDFELQVTSYGADMPLIHERQYRKYLHRPVSIRTGDDKMLEGVILDLEQEKMQVEPVIKPKKKGQKSRKGEPVEVAFSQIKEIKPVLKF